MASDLVKTAIVEIERRGVKGFSLRCVARAIGCDAATLSYRFGSREGLERAVADHLHSEIEAPERDLEWQQRLTSIARAYHKIARRYPNAYRLLLRFLTSGPCDPIIAEEWHRALYKAGLSESDIPAVSCAVYAAVLTTCEFGAFSQIESWARQTRPRDRTICP